MNTIFLLDVSNEDFDVMKKLVADRKAVFIDTTNCEEELEYDCIVGEVEHLKESDNHLLMAKFTGRMNVIEDIGGVCSEMVYTISCNPSSPYHVESPTDMFKTILKIVEKGD